MKTHAETWYIIELNTRIVVGQYESLEEAQSEYNYMDQQGTGLYEIVQTCA